MNDGEYCAFPLDDRDEVECVICRSFRDHTAYKKGEAFLVGAAHPPYDGNANYVCKEHLDPQFSIVEEST